MIGLKETLRFIRAAYPGNEEVLKDVVHVEIWNYAMKRFAKGDSLADIFEDVTEEAGIKTEDDQKRLLEIIIRASREWKFMIPGAFTVEVG